MLLRPPSHNDKTLDLIKTSTRGATGRALKTSVFPIRCYSFEIGLHLVFDVTLQLRGVRREGIDLTRELVDVLAYATVAAVTATALTPTP